MRRYIQLRDLKGKWSQYIPHNKKDKENKKGTQVDEVYATNHQQFCKSWNTIVSLEIKHKSWAKIVETFANLSITESRS